MTLMNPTLPASLGGTAPVARRAVNLQAFLGWQARRTWQALERVGQRRAAPELRRAAARLAANHPALASDLTRLADAWSAPASVEPAATAR